MVTPMGMRVPPACARRKHVSLEQPYLLLCLTNIVTPMQCAGSGVKIAEHSLARFSSPSRDCGSALLGQDTSSWWH
eukprot:4356251-Prorocentrum_lima.AAC.1